jgi:hypothetical protein
MKKKSKSSDKNKGGNSEFPPLKKTKKFSNLIRLLLPHPRRCTDYEA